MRRRHGRAAHRLVAAAQRRAQDIVARRAEVYRGRAEVAEVGHGIVPVRRCHGHDVRQVIGGRIRRVGAVVVVGVVPRRRNEQDVGGPCAGDGVILGLRIVVPAVAGVDDLCAVLDRVVDGRDDRAVGDEVVADLERHDPDVPIYADHAYTVVADGSDGSGHVRAVTKQIHRIPVSVVVVVAVIVVDEAVGVVVNAVGRDLVDIDPHVVAQVRVCVVHTGVDDRNDRTVRPADPVPRLRRIDVRIGHSARQTAVVQAPHRGELRIVGYDEGRLDVVRLRV